MFWRFLAGGGERVLVSPASEELALSRPRAAGAAASCDCSRECML